MLNKDTVFAITCIDVVIEEIHAAPYSVENEGLLRAMLHKKSVVLADFRTSCRLQLVEQV